MARRAYTRNLEIEYNKLLKKYNRSKRGDRTISKVMKQDAEIKEVYGLTTAIQLTGYKWLTVKREIMRFMWIAGTIIAALAGLKPLYGLAGM